MQLKILDTVLPVFLSLFVGILIRKSKLIDRGGMDGIRKLALNITITAVVFSAFATADYSSETIGIPVFSFLIVSVELALGYLGKHLFKLSHCEPFLMSGAETGMLGYGLFALLFKDQSNSVIALLDLGAAAFVFTVYKALACGKNNLRDSLLSAFRSTVLWGIIFGALFGATGLTQLLNRIGIGETIISASDFLAAPTGVLILLGIGYDLDFSNIRWKHVSRLCVIRVVITAVLFPIALIADRQLMNGIVPLGTLILFFILPPPYLVPMFAETDEERADISSSLSVLTILCLAEFTVLSFFF